MIQWFFQFEVKVFLMRKHQKAWFLDHGLHDLSEAKRYEAEVDKELRARLVIELRARLVIENGEPKEIKSLEELPAEPKQASMFGE